MVVWRGERRGPARCMLDGEGARALLGVGPLEERVATVARGERGGVGKERGSVDVVGDRGSGRGAVAAPPVVVVWVQSEGPDDGQVMNM